MFKIIEIYVTAHEWFDKKRIHETLKSDTFWLLVNVLSKLKPICVIITDVENYFFFTVLIGV